jgi:hypothetical protein
VVKSLENYPYKDIACELIKGLKFGSPLNYSEPRSNPCARFCPTPLRKGCLKVKLSVVFSGVDIYRENAIIRWGVSEAPSLGVFIRFTSLAIKDKTNISLTIKILHLRQDSFTRKVRTIFTLKIIVSIFVKLFLILVLHFVRIFVKKGY